MKYAIIALSLFLSISFAQETDASIESRQKAVLLALDSIEENVIGFAINGRAKGGILSSTMSSEALPDEKDISEYLAFSDFLLNISVRPSNETKATFDLRFHKDWQSAYREGNNSPIIRWWSYDGSILDKKLKFNLGTIRIAYTPLTIYLPEPDLIMEPEIFASLKKEAMEERYLDGTNRRLLQGLNAEFKTPVGIFDNIFLQGTLVRLHKTANIGDRIFYDFDPTRDRFSTAANIGAETYGLSIVASAVYTFNRFSSSLKNTQLDSLIDYERNKVFSFELGYDSRKSLNNNAVNFGASVEYAFSNWEYWQHELKEKREKILILGEGDLLIPSYTPPPVLNPSGNQDVVTASIYPYYAYNPNTQKEYELSLIEKQKYKGALFANAFVAYKQSPFDAKLSGNFLNTDKNFESELAASPAYLPNLPILNSNANLNSALEQFRTSSLENMYYSLYYSLPMNAITIVSGSKGKPDNVIGGQEISNSGNLYNNYKFSQYYRNAYTQQTFSRLERDSISYRLDPAINLALPYGYATPDRNGGDANLNFVWNKSVSVRGVFGMYSSEVADYTRFGGGLEIDIAHLASLSKALVLSGSYEQNKEESKKESGLLNPQVDRIMVGTKIGIWRGLSFIAGFQQLNKEFKNPLEVAVDPDIGIVTLNRTSEMLAIGGPQVKISEGADFSLQGGLLSNSIEGNGIKLDLDKYIVSGIVTVEF
jgi:hypothetical protein